MKPTLILVGADKGGVGKTTVSRALLDFFARKNILTRAFDTENPRGTWIGIADSAGTGPAAAGIGAVTLGAFRSTRRESNDPAESLREGLRLFLKLKIDA